MWMWHTCCSNTIPYDLEMTVHQQLTLIIYLLCLIIYILYSYLRSQSRVFLIYLIPSLLEKCVSLFILIQIQSRRRTTSTTQISLHPSTVVVVYIAISSHFVALENVHFNSNKCVWYIFKHFAKYYKAFKIICKMFVFVKTTVMEYSLIQQST